MTITVGEPVFLDTNVLVYANVAAAPLHAEALAKIEQRYAAGSELWISRQVLKEYLATLSRLQSFALPQPLALLADRVRYFQARFRVADEDGRVTEKLLTLLESTSTGGKQVHDANIVATMETYGIRSLLTGNPGDFARFSHLITIESLETAR